MTKQTVLQQIARIREAKVEELIRQYRDLFGREPPTRDYQHLRRVLVHRIQEIHFGALDEETREKLLAVGREVEKRQRGAVRLDAARGTQWRREWNGTTYVVTATGDGRYEWNGAVYGSLTAVATAITGTHRNGKKWFLEGGRT